MEKVQLGIIGGSGIYGIDQISNLIEVDIDTPYGKPSGSFVIGELNGIRLAFLPRHGKGHRILPNEINYQANIFGFKSLGVERIVSISACGSLREDIAPRDIIIPDQLIDFTKNRNYTFFGDGIVSHIDFAHPFCSELSEIVFKAVENTGARVHDGGAFITIEGPRFSSKAESKIYQQWGADIIGMTASPEAVLAREAEICYCTLAHVTDYDVWHETEESVNIGMVTENLSANIGVTREAIKRIVNLIGSSRNCGCGHALENAIFTERNCIPKMRVQELGVLVNKYLPPDESF